MEEKIYILTRIDGEYAYLKDEANPSDEELFIALALLPIGSDIGSRLAYVFPNFTLL